MTNEKGMGEESKPSIVSDELRSFVGREMNAHSFELSEEFIGPMDTELPEAVEVTRQDLKRWMNVTGNPNPMWETVAPPTFIVNLPVMHRMLQAMIRVHSRGGFARFGMNGGQEIEYYMPIRVGDSISCTAKLLPIEEKTTRRGSKVALTVFEVLCTNQRGELAAKYWMTNIFMGEHYPQSPGENVPRPRPFIHGQVKATLLERGLLEVVKRKQPTYGDVKVGDEIPTMVQPITSRRLVRWGLISPDYTEHHYDLDIAHERGLPRCVTHGSIIYTFLGRLVTDFMGEKGILKRLKCNYRRAQYVSDDVICKGKVAKKYVKDGEHRVELEIGAENPRGEICVPGQAVVVLPA
ncbi:MaoC family dehydratase N-terminal domain-containing protein [Chloroflexota bacterium]